MSVEQAARSLESIVNKAAKKLSSIFPGHKQDAKLVIHDFFDRFNTKVEESALQYFSRMKELHEMGLPIWETARAMFQDITEDLEILLIDLVHHLEEYECRTDGDGQFIRLSRSIARYAKVFISVYEADVSLVIPYTAFYQFENAVDIVVANVFTVFADRQFQQNQRTVTVTGD